MAFQLRSHFGSVLTCTKGRGGAPLLQRQGETPSFPLGAQSDIWQPTRSLDITWFTDRLTPPFTRQFLAFLSPKDTPDGSTA